MTEAGAGLKPLCEAQGGAHLIGDGGTDVLQPSLVDLDDLGQQLDALLARREREGLERAPRRRHRLVDIRRRAESDLVQGLLGRGVDDGKRLLRPGILPGTVDVELETLNHDRNPLRELLFLHLF